MRVGVTVSRLVRFLLVPLFLAAITLGAPLSAGAAGRSFTQTNLVSNLGGVALHTDPNLRNPWGLVHGPTTPWWVSDNGAGVSTLYQGNGTAVPLVVTVPPGKADPSETGTPTGVVFNNAGNGFVVTANGKSASSVFIFASEDGTIAVWSPTVDRNNAVTEADQSLNGAVYKGLAFGFEGTEPRLYATNFHAGTVDVYDSSFQPVVHPTAFLDRSIPPGYAPFGIQAIGSEIYVTYAKQDADRHDDVAGPGNGFVDVFDTSGNLLRRNLRQGALNSPWGVALAPPDFGPFGGALLVGNFGDGLIHAYDPLTGRLLGTLQDASGAAIRIDGLWGLGFGNGAAAGPTSTLFFTAGLNGEQDGLFGSIVANPT